MQLLSKNKKQTLARFCIFSMIAMVVFSFLFSLPTSAHAQEEVTIEDIEEGCRTDDKGNRRTGRAFDICVGNETSKINQDPDKELKGGDDDVRWYHKVGSFIGNLILTIAALFTWAGGTLLDRAVTEVVLGMGAKIKGGGVGDSINNAWTIIRDFCNLAFIFGFVWIGLQTILKGFDGAGVKRTLSALIIAALLINFSLFFSKVVIDVSNVLAVEIHEVLSVDKTGKSDNKGIAAHFMNQMGLLSIWDVEAEQLASVTDGGSPAFFIMGALFLMIAAFVFAAGGILLIIRFVTLIFLMIFSPILFASLAFEGTRQYSTKLWKMLLGQAFFAPIYLLMLLISFRVVLGLTGNNAANQDFVEVLREGEQIKTILDFSIIILFMILSLLAAKSVSAVGASRAIAVGGNLRKWGQGVVGRNTVGALSYGTRKAYEAGDARMMNTKTGKWTRRALNVGTLGLTSDKAVRGTLRKGETAKFGSSQSFEDSQKETQAIRSRRGNIQAEQEFQKIYKKGVAENASPEDKVKLEKAVAHASTKMLENLSTEQLKNISHMLTGSQVENLAKSDKFNESQIGEISKARSDAIKDIYEQNKEDLAKASTEHLTAMGSDYLKESQHAIMLRSSQMDDLKKKLTKTEFEEISNARNSAFETLGQGLFIDITDANGNTVDTKGSDHIINMKPGEASKLPAGALKPLADQLPISTLEKIARDGTLKKDDQADMRSTIEGYINAAPGQQAARDYDEWLQNSPLGKQFGK